MSSEFALVTGEANVMQRGPIFIGGVEHSGKTLMRSSLAAHPDIAITRRTYMWTRFYNRYGDLSQPANFERCLAAMLQHKPMSVLQPDRERIRREFWQGKPTYARLFALFHQHHAEREGKLRWGDQLGSVERYADQIFAAYPDAKMIHMIRDPRDRYEESIPLWRLGKGWVGGATEKWRSSAKLAQRNRQRYPDSYLIVTYEKLLFERERTLREVCDFLDEEFVPAMLTPKSSIRLGDNKDDDDIADAIPAKDVAPIASRKTASRSMSRRELMFMQAYAKHEMEVYGYKLAPLQLSLSDRFVFMCVEWPINLATMLASRTLADQ